MKGPLVLNARDPEKRREAMEKAVRIIAQGGIVAYPTESFYGLAVDASNEEALKRLFQVKQRPFDRPILLLISDEREVLQYAREIPQKAWTLMGKIWPGRLTLVFEARSDVSPLVTGGSGKVGLRISSNSTAFSLARTACFAITGTSANLSSRPPCLTAQDVVDTFGARIGAVLDGGPAPGGRGTTVLDVSEDPPRIIRQGMVSRTELEKLLEKVSE